MSGSETTVAVKGDERTVRVVAKRPNCSKQTFRFMPSPKPGEGRAAKWLQTHLPLESVIDETRATIQGGGELEVTGCLISDLYTIPSAETSAQAPTPEPAVEEPRPEPAPLPNKTTLKKLTPAHLKALCEERGIPVSGKTSKSKMIELLGR